MCVLLFTLFIEFVVVRSHYFRVTQRNISVKYLFGWSSKIFAERSHRLFEVFENHQVALEFSEIMCSRFITPIIFGIQRQRPEETESSCLDSILEIRASMEKSLHTYLHQGEAVQHNLYYSITV